MNKTILATALVAITSLNLFAQQPSAFGAGNINNPSPYGLTSTEKMLLENKKAIEKAVVKNNNQANNVDSLRERIDGLQSIVESLSRKSHTNKMALSELTDKNTESLKNKDEYEVRLAELVAGNSKAIEKNALVIEEMSKLIDTINMSFVTKEEFNDLVSSVNEFKTLVSKELKAKSKPKVSTLESMQNSEVEKKAKAFFDKKFYTKGIEYYSHLISENYRPANAHFMVGQMKFKRKNYAEAISFYKKSASLYAEASYMPDLMLNTAISMDETGDLKNAKAFYNGVIAKFPDSAQAIRAKEYLEYMN